MENHDNPRMSTKYSPEMVPLFMALKLLLPGIDVTYYGSEIGMENTFVRPDQIQDPNNAGGDRFEESRDNERCPMQWDSSINAGTVILRITILPKYSLKIKEYLLLGSSIHNGCYRVVFQWWLTQEFSFCS